MVTLGSENPVRFATWNVGHQTRRKAIPQPLATALAALKTDVLVLTEYVAGPSHEDFTRALLRSGFTQVITTAYVPGENQVLLASRPSAMLGNLQCCNLSPATKPNWLHANIGGVDVIGFRVPMFTIPGGRPRYWEWLRETLNKLADRPTVLLGDLNAAASYRHLRAITSDGWKLVTPATGWSFRGKNGNTSVIDHGLISRHFAVRQISYVRALGDQLLAGGKDAYSDHALLEFELATVTGR